MRAFGLIGPLAGWELRRLARRGTALRVRLVLLYVLLLAFIGFAIIWFDPIPAWDVFSGRLPRFTRAEAHFANAFVLALLETQLVLVVAFTPAVAASAVAEEKDRHTLPLLLTTQLSDREIVFGKAAGRIAFVLATVFSGLPILALTMLFGGVDVAVLAAGYALAGGTVVLCAAIGIHAACRAPDLRSAVLRAYAGTAVLVCGAFVPPLVFASPFALLVVVHGEGDRWGTLIGIGYPLVQVAVAVLFLAAGAKSLRLREPSAGPPPTTAFPEPPRPAPPALLRPDDEPRPDLPPVDDTDPVLWKERCIGWRPAWNMPHVAKGLSALAVGLAAVLFVGGGWVLAQRVSLALHPERAAQLADRPGAPDSGGWLLVSASVFAAGRYLLPLTVALSGAVAGERRRGTLDALLATPLNRRAILWTKARVPAERGTAFATMAVAAIGMAFTADGGVRLGACAAVLALCGFGLVLALGAWLTVQCPTDTRAFRLLMPATVVAIGWPVGAWQVLTAGSDLASPPAVLAPVLLSAAGACGVLALVLWWLAGRALERGV